MEALTKDMKIFSYRTQPVSGWEGDDGGFSLELYGNGNLRYCIYKLFDQIQLMQMFKLNRKTVYAVYHIIEKEKEQLLEIPERLDNGSEDGVTNAFEFYGCGRITAVNIQETFIPGMMIKNHAKYQSYKENMKYENTVLKVFKEICKGLKVEEISLSLDACEVLKDCKLKVTW